MQKNYSLEVGDVLKIFDDMNGTIEVIVGGEKYVANNNCGRIDRKLPFICKRMDGYNYNINEETNYTPYGKLDAINTILSYAGTYTYRTWAKKAQAS